MSAFNCELIRVRREELNMTQAELAELMGLKETGSISTWEHGTAKLNTDKLFLLAQTLKVDVGYFFGEGGDKCSADEKDLLMTYRQMSKRDRVIYLNQGKCYPVA